MLYLMGLAIGKVHATLQSRGKLCTKEFKSHVIGFTLEVNICELVKLMNFLKGLPFFLQLVVSIQNLSLDCLQAFLFFSSPECGIIINSLHLSYGQVCDSDTMLDPASSVEMVKVLEEDPMVGGVGGDVQVNINTLHIKTCF